MPDPIQLPHLVECRVHWAVGCVTLERLEVEEAHRYKGIGTQAVTLLKAQASAARCAIRVTPMADDDDRQGDLVKFYRRQGFSFRGGDQETMFWTP